MTTIEAVGVVIPARDEEASLPAALASVAAASQDIGCSVTTVVVCDSCRDRSAEVASAAGALVVETRVGCPGGARRVGVDVAALHLRHVSSSALWIASTDADCVVRVDWLRTHRSAAEAGWDGYIGEVAVPDWSEWPGALPDLYEHHYRRAGRPPPVHGANLGVRLDAYMGVGGFRPVAHGEDQLLIDCLIAAGYSVLASRDEPVQTSARRVARAGHGFSAHLRSLERQILAPQHASPDPPVTPLLS